MPAPALRPFNRVFEDRHRLIGDYKQLLPETDDLTLMVLKGHLILEEMLFALVREHCAKPEYLEGARLSFAQLLRLAQSLVSAPVPEEVWTAIAEINRLRNALAHNLRPTDVETRVEEVYRAAIVGDLLPASRTSLKLVNSEDPTSEVRTGHISSSLRRSACQRRDGFGSE